MTCPICNKPVDPAMRPFCSKRCADVDLHRWLTGSYVVPGRDGEALEEAAQADTGQPDRQDADSTSDGNER